MVDRPTQRRDEHLFHAEEDIFEILQMLHCVRWDLHVQETLRYGTKQHAIVRLKKAIEHSKLVEANLKVVIKELENG